MKKFLLSIAIVTGFAACNTSQKQDDSRDIQLLTDSTAYRNNYYSDTSTQLAAEPIVKPEAKPQPRVITKIQKVYVPVKSHPVSPVYEPPVSTPPVATPVPASVPGPVATGDNTAQTGQGAGTDASNGTATTEEEKKKGWSNATKGAVIGAGAGAIGGAVIAKKKGLGAVVGGVVGAAGGYIIGKDMDKRKAGN